MNVFKMRCLVRTAGRTAHHHTDLIFLDGIPHAVIEWAEHPDGSRVPKVKVRLDPQQLTPLNWPQVQYLYGGTIEDPRSFD